MDEILGRIYQREEAALKRERAMAYAFSHQVCYSIMYHCVFVLSSYPNRNSANKLNAVEGQL